MEILNFTVSGDYKVKFTAALERDAWVPFLSQISGELQKKKPIKGFRNGSAPLPLAEREYGEALYKPAAKNAADACIEKVCLEKGILPVSLPVVEIFEVGAKGFACAVSFDKYPEVDSMEYKGLKAEKPVCKCREEDIDADIARFMSQHLHVHEVDREARMGDIAQIDFSGTHNGEAFPFNQSSEFRLVLGSGVLFVGLDEILCGHSAGDTLQVSLTMPENFHRSEVAGLTLDLHVHLQSVWARDMRELNDAFVKEFVKDAETVQDYREQVRQKLQKRLDERSEKLFHANLNAEIARKLPVQIPPSMVETTAKRYLDTLAAFARGQEITVEQYLAREGKTVEDYKKLVEPAAWEQTAVSVAVDYVISTEKLTVAPERLQRYYERFAAGNKITVEEAKRRVNEPALIDDYLHKDAMKRIRESAVPVIVEVDVLPNEI